MAITRTETQVTWPTAQNSATITGNSGNPVNQLSEEVTLDDTCVSAIITMKADHTATPQAGDNVVFYAMATAGDPDGASTDEFPSTEPEGIFLAYLDVGANDPSVVTAVLPPFKKLKILAVSRVYNNVTVSATILEQRAA